MVLERGIATEDPLTGNGEYVSEWVDIQRAQNLVGAVESDQNGELFVEQSQEEGSPKTVHVRKAKDYKKGDPMGFEVPVLARYGRVRFVNDATDQTEFHLHMDRKR